MVAPQMQYVERRRWVPFVFLVPTLMGALSWVAGGLPALSDAAIGLLIILLILRFIRELQMFGLRLGVGAMVMSGGALIWWCYDYCIHWWGLRPIDFDTYVDPYFPTNVGMPPWVVAKAVCLHAMFIMMMSFGLTVKWKSMGVKRVLHWMWEPINRNAVFTVILFIFLASLTPYLLSSKGFFNAIWLSIFAGRGGEDNGISVGRTGSVNTSWWGYLSQLVELGYFGGFLAAFYAVTMSRSALQSIACWGIFALQCALAFGTGTRGNTMFVVAPVVCLVFIRHHTKITGMLVRFSPRAYITSMGIGLMLMVLMQIQGFFRNQGFKDVMLDEIDFGTLQGNEMFTTTLPGLAAIPELSAPFAAPFPGAGWFTCVPDMIRWFVINPIPRVIWQDKPIDYSGLWYKHIVTGTDISNAEGTTISSGLVGEPYIKYGMPGVLQLGFIFGWLLRNCEVSLRQAVNRPMAMLATLGLLVFLLRSFRNFWFHSLYPVIYSCILISIILALIGGGRDRNPDGEVQYYEQ